MTDPEAAVPGLSATEAAQTGPPGVPGAGKPSEDYSGPRAHDPRSPQQLAADAYRHGALLAREALAELRARDGRSTPMFERLAAVLDRMAVYAEAGSLLGEPMPSQDPARQLVEQALHLRMYGERAPGAPTDPAAETWADWDRRAQAWAREGL